VFEIHISDAAKRDLINNVDWWSENRSADEAERWYVAILESIYSLEQMPERCPLAREAEALGIELHNLWFGLSGKHTHRTLFTISSTNVNVLRVLSTRRENKNLNLDENVNRS